MATRKAVHQSMDLVSYQELTTAMRELFKATVRELQDRTRADAADRLFFPQGIQKIHFVLSIGQKDAPVASIEIEVSGQKSETAASAERYS